MNLTVRMADRAEPLRLTRITPIAYPVTPEITALANQIVGDEERPDRRAARIESWMVSNFRYLPNDAPATREMTIEQFLLRTRAGHCEYFAAGMVVLLSALDVPARIAGGYYGGRLNPLTGYYTIRLEDAHAWTEVWDGRRWLTYDATPPALRPGNATKNRIGDYLSAISDSLTFLWDRWVLTFGIGDQITLVEDAIEWAKTTSARLRDGMREEAAVIRSPRYLGMLLLLVAGGLAAALVVRRRRPLFEVLARHLATLGIRVGPAMTMEEALAQLRRDHPDAARALEPLILMYEEERFSSRADRERAATIRRRLAELRG